jgi:hypothetical protein
MDDRKQGMQRWFLIAAIAWVAMIATVFVVQTMRGEGPFARHAEFTEFSICKGPDPATGIEEPVTTPAATGETLQVCGYLKADGPATLSFLLLYEEQPIKWFVLSKQYRTGPLFEPFTLPGQQPGNYRVEAYLSRGRLASTEFTVAGEP